MKQLFLVSLLAVCFIVNLSIGAVVKSEEFAEQLRRIVHEMHPDSLRTQRATESGNFDQPKRICYETPCGWNEYDPTTRRGTTFMPNTCKCPDETYKCVRTGENVSISSYVYHCLQNTTAEDIDESADDSDYFS
ncbi:hypothetical protein ANTQUA_LOCUS10348 [Anthophora quadrimaculata]